MTLLRDAVDSEATRQDFCVQSRALAPSFDKDDVHRNIYVTADKRRQATVFFAEVTNLRDPPDVKHSYAGTELSVQETLELIEALHSYIIKLREGDEKPS